VCRDQKNSGATDFSYATIGRLSKKRGGIGERSIYNPTASGKIYRQQIDAWARHATTSIKKKPQQRIVDDWSILNAIDKSSVRAEVSILLSRLSKLEGQISEFRRAANEDRVILLGASPGAGSLNLLSEDERSALRRAISPAFLSQQNWICDESNDIRTLRGARVLPREYVVAIQKILGEPDGRGRSTAKRIAEGKSL